MKKKINRKLKKVFIPLLSFLVVFCLCFGLSVNADTLIYQSNPFIFQGTATDNGESIADVTPSAFLFEKRGHSEVVNNDIVDSNGQYLYNIGRQQWDEEWELGGIDIDTGVEFSTTSRIRSKNFTRVIPSCIYYGYTSSNGTPRVSFYDNGKSYLGSYVSAKNTTFTTPNNCSYIRIWCDNSYGTTYNDDITISLYYVDEDGYDQYYPYEVVSYVDTGNEVLRSAGSVYDVKYPNGNITRKVGYVDLGTLTFTKGNTSSSGVYRFGAALTGIKRSLNASFIANVLCPSFNAISNASSYQGSYGIAVAHNETSIFLSGAAYNSMTADQFKSAMSGVILYFELEEEVVDVGTAYSQNYYVDDFGSQYWLDHDMNFVEVGQAGLYGYQFDFVYSWFDNLIHAIVGSFKGVGSSVLNFIKDGFVSLFCITEVQEVDGVDVEVITGPSPLVYYTFALMGLSLIFGLTYYLVNMLRRSR